MHRALTLCVALAALGCSRPPQETAAPPTTATTSEHDPEILAVAREYLKYGRVDDMNRWSPTLCTFKPSHAAVSRSRDEATHGRKIYYLFARHRDAYVGGIKEPQPDGQAIVKEAWKPVEVSASAGAAREQARSDEGGSFTTRATLEGKTYTIGAKAGLFIMLKRGGSWTYATVTPEGDRIVQSGRISSCIDCHRDAQPDSLFGLSAHSETW